MPSFIIIWTVAWAVVFTFVPLAIRIAAGPERPETSARPCDPRPRPSRSSPVVITATAVDAAYVRRRNNCPDLTLRQMLTDADLAVMSSGVW